MNKKFTVTKKLQEEVNKSRKECGIKEEPIKPDYELNCLPDEDMQDLEIFLSPKEKEKIKTIFEDKEIVEEDELKRLKNLRNKKFDSIVLGELYLNCYSVLFDNLHLFGELDEKLKKILNEFEPTKLRNLFEDYGNGEDIGSHYAGEKIKDLVKLNRIKLNKLVNLFFEISKDE